MEITILALAGSIVITGLWMYCRSVQAQETLNSFLISDIQDSRSFAIVERICRIGLREPSNYDKDKNIKYERYIDFCESAINDVFMQQGFDPRAYNVRGMIEYTIHKYRFDKNIVFKQTKKS